MASIWRPISRDEQLARSFHLTAGSVDRPADGRAGLSLGLSRAVPPSRWLLHARSTRCQCRRRLGGRQRSWPELISIWSTDVQTSSYHLSDEIEVELLSWQLFVGVVRDSVYFLCIQGRSRRVPRLGLGMQENRLRVPGCMNLHERRRFFATPFSSSMIFRLRWYRFHHRSRSGESLSGFSNKQGAADLHQFEATSRITCIGTQFIIGFNY